MIGRGGSGKLRWTRFAMGVVLGAVVIYVGARGWTEARTILREPQRLVVPVLLIAVGLIAAARAWLGVARRPGSSGVGLGSAFLASMPAKYLPGGAAFQAVTQVGLSVDGRSGLAATSIAYVVFAVLQLATGMLVGSLYAVVGINTSIPLRLVVGVGVFAVLAVRRGWMSSLVSFGYRIARREPPSEPIPDQSTLNRSFLLALVPMVLSGAALALILDPTAGSILRIVPAFAASWAAGFALVPIPAGLGVREAVLVALLPSYGAAAIVAASLLHRLATLTAELVLMGFAWRSAFVGRRSRRSSG